MDQIIQAASFPIQAKVTIPGSKSITNRALLLAALAEGVSEISDLLISDDTVVMIQALESLGVEVSLNKSTHTCSVEGSGGKFPQHRASVWCGDSGIVLRFLLAACSASPGIYQFSGSTQLSNRPITELLRVLKSLGVKVDFAENAPFPITISMQGSLQGGKVVVNASETGQFISALLMIAPFAQMPFDIQATDVVSSSYIQMTRKMMAEFGVTVQRSQSGSFYVPVTQRYKARDYKVEPDFSTASYFFASAAITGGEVTIQNVDVENSKQGDAAFLEILKKMGCSISQNKSGLIVKGAKKLCGMQVDMGDCADVFMTLAVIAPFANTPTLITHIGHARFKESNRLAVMFAELEKLGVKVEKGLDWLKVYPSTPRGTAVDSHQDHRIAMAFAVMGLRVPGIIIRGAECVSKTCPEFFRLWHRLYREPHCSQ